MTRSPRILMGALTLLIGGCAGSAPSSRDPTVSEDAAASPVVYAEKGLEIRWWIVGDRHADIARVLAPYAERETPADDESLSRWERSGLRLVAVPLERLTQVRDGLPRVGTTNRQWIGESGVWLDALGGPVLDRSWTVMIDEATAQLPPGQVRLLVRAWLMPRLTDGRAEGVLHVELMPQLRLASMQEDGFNEQFLPTGGRPRSRDIESLRLVMEVGPEDALLIVPEQPGVTWGDAPVIEEPGVPTIGPTPTYPTLGGAMLTDSPAGLGPVNKAIIVLIPRVPDRFEITAR